MYIYTYKHFDIMCICIILCIYNAYRSKALKTSHLSNSDICKNIYINKETLKWDLFGTDQSMYADNCFSIDKSVNDILKLQLTFLLKCYVS